MESRSITDTAPFHTPIRYLKGVGPEREVLLERLGIKTIGDLLLHRPRRYEDRRCFVQIRELQRNVPAAVRGRVFAMGSKLLPRSRKTLFELILQDPTGYLTCQWWNTPYMEQYFHIGQELIVYGAPTSLSPPTMVHPEVEELDSNGQESFLHIGRLVPIYPATEGITQRQLRLWIWRALELIDSIPEPYPIPVPPELLPLERAIRLLHFPETEADIEAARRRLAFEELVPLQYELQRRRYNLETRAKSPPCPGTNQLIRPFLKHLGFELTKGQIEVLREIREDMSRSIPMRRLLQGDVGSGKTVVAACAALMALESGYDVVMMVPTEVLALQQYERFQRWFAPLGIPIVLFTGSKRILPASEPELTAQASPSSSNPPTLYLGTHALLNQSFDPQRLGLVIIDEQHKFGVAQRERLLRKGRHPHLLVMTATPIPRTLGLTLYGDLDLSIIQDMPPGRSTVRTYVRSEARLPKVWEFVRSQLQKGRQAYIIYPRLGEEDETHQVKAVLTQYHRLRSLLAPYRVAVMHGRLPGPTKQRVLEAFRENQIQALICTSVVEVGLDVPNATVMVIENADRFGLAQLHQLRGRIGRGPHPAYCILISSTQRPEALRRLRALTETTDGFRIAEIDLRLRGPGEFLGKAQSGFPKFRFVDLIQDLPLFHQARQFARQLVELKEKHPSPSANLPFLFFHRPETNLSLKSH